MTAILSRTRPDPQDPTRTVEQDVAIPALCPDCLAKDDALEASLDRSARAPTKPRSIEDWLESIGVNTRKHGHASLDNFDTADSPLAGEACRSFVEDVIASGPHDPVRGVYLAGMNEDQPGRTGNGNGKSHLAVGVMRAVRLARPDLSIMFDPADRLVTKVQDSYGTGTTDELIEARKRTGLYVLDDLGREKGTADALRVLCTILDERERAPTVITSNALPEQLAGRYHDEAMWNRVVSRLGDEVYRYVAVRGPDRRRRLGVAS